MKITLDIPNEHAPRLLALLSDLMPVRLEPQADPAEGHPELPLSPFTPETLKNLRDIGSYRPPTMPDDESEAIAETRWAPVQGIDAADPLKVEMEDVRIFPPKSFETASTVPPVVGRRFWMRNGEVVKVVSCKAQLDSQSAQYEAMNDLGARLRYDLKGKNIESASLDLVQQCPL